MIEDETLFENKLRVKRRFPSEAQTDSWVRLSAYDLRQSEIERARQDGLSMDSEEHVRSTSEKWLADGSIDVLAGVVDYDYRGNVGVIWPTLETRILR